MRYTLQNIVVAACVQIAMSFASGCASRIIGAGTRDLQLIHIPLNISCAVTTPVSADDTIDLNATVQNVSSADASYSYMDPVTDFHFELFKDGRAVRRTADGLACDTIFNNRLDFGLSGGSQLAVKLQPLQTRSVTINLKQLFRIEGNGAYTILVTKVLWADEHRVWIGTSAKFYGRKQLKRMKRAVIDSRGHS